MCTIPLSARKLEGSLAPYLAASNERYISEIYILRAFC
jgi:hypothetical protein